MKPYYEDGKVTLYCGKAEEVLPVICSTGKFDLLLTDPPYGIGADKDMAQRSGKQYGQSAAANGKYEYFGWDNEPPSKALLDLCISKTKRQIIWGGNYFDLGPATCYLVWDKENGTNDFADCELAWTNLDKAVRMKRHMWNGMLRKGGEARNGHPTQKPLDVIKWCIKQCGEPLPTSILDPFAGSGTTLEAGKSFGIESVGIEREERYCELIANRLAQESMAQEVLF